MGNHLSQSPSLRGSGRFWRAPPSPPSPHGGFNPLHCGAVVASSGAPRGLAPRLSFQSPSLRGSGRFIGPWTSERSLTRLFQSPSLRGSGRFRRAGRARADLAEFQSPSLRGSGRFPGAPARTSRRPARFNPLHCGAVVASRIGMLPLASFRARFNPLHCGAVVASNRDGLSRADTSSRFQSPSLRGSGRF